MHPPDIRSAAVDLRESGDYPAAADRYTSAGYAELAEGNFDIGMQGDRLGTGLYCLLAASLCYRLANAPVRSRTRCEEGIMVAAEYRDYVVEHRAQVGLLYEFQGDFEIIGEIDDGVDLYERAAQIYENEVTTHIGWASEPMFEWNWKFIREIATAAEWPIPDKEHVYSELERRARYKRETFADRIEAVVAGGNW